MKAGSIEKIVNKIAVAMFATPSVIKKAAEWGADLMIVHEPLYYNHYDNHSDEIVENAKRKLLEDSGITVYRYHDHPHAAKPDLIALGELKKLVFKGTVEYTDTFDLVRIILDKKIVVRELAKKVEDSLNLKHIRIAGCVDHPVKKIPCMFGTPGGMFDELKNENCELLVTGEVCEWALCEYARDAAELGFAKAVFTLGHVGSERDGMESLAEQMQEHFSEIEVQYFECGEVYSYTDDKQSAI